MTTFLAGFEPRYGTRRNLDDATAGAKINTSGYQLGVNGRLCRCGKSHKPGSKAEATCPKRNVTVDWAKQDKITGARIGPPNVQADSQADGRQVAGAGKGQKDKK